MQRQYLLGLLMCIFLFPFFLSAISFTLWGKGVDVYLLPFARSCLGAVLTSSDHVLSAFAEALIGVAVQFLSTF